MLESFQIAMKKKASNKRDDTQHEAVRFGRSQLVLIFNKPLNLKTFLSEKYFRRKKFICTKAFQGSAWKFHDHLA